MKGENESSRSRLYPRSRHEKSPLNFSRDFFVIFGKLSAR